MITEQARFLQKALLARHAPELFGEAAEEFVLPHYAGHSLANVPATLAAFLGMSLPGVAPALDQAYWKPLCGGVRRIIVVLLDALGYLRLQPLIEADPEDVWSQLAGRGLLLPLTSIFPSTTNAALVTLLTGQEPLSHGILGYELWLRQYGVLAEMLALKPAYGTGKETLVDWGLVPEEMIPVPGLGDLFARQGVQTTAVVPAQFTRSALTRMLYRGFQQMFGYTSADGLWALTRYVLSRDESPTSIYLLYWGAIDRAAHQHGSAGEHWQAQYRAVSQACRGQFLSALTPREREGTLLIMIADHGFVDTPLELAYNTEGTSPLSRHLLLPFSGESRAAYLHCRDGDSDQVGQALREVLGPDYVVCRTADVLRQGLWGTHAPAPESLARLGHYTAFARGQHYLDRKDLRLKLRGRHGGLTPHEMLVPWLAVRLDA